MHRRLSVLFALPLLLASVHASSEKPPQVDVEFTAVAWGPAIEELAFEGGATELFIPAFARSKPYHYSGPADLKLYAERVNAVGKPELLQVASVRIPDDVNRVTLLVSETKGEHYEIMAIRENPEMLRGGHARLINLTPHTVAVKGPSHTVQINPGQQAEMRAVNDRLPIAVAAKYGDSWEPVCNNIYSLPEDQRRTIFLTNSNADFFKEETEDGFVRTNPINLERLEIAYLQSRHRAIRWFDRPLPPNRRNYRLWFLRHVDGKYGAAIHLRTDCGSRTGNQRFGGWRVRSARRGCFPSA